MTPGSVSGGDPGVGFLAAIVIGLLALLLAFGVWRSRRSGVLSRSEPDAVYRGMVGFATRLGYGQLPTQTAYEYAGALGDLVPAAREELQLVARAKVEVTYGRRTVPGDRLVALHAAYRRLRVRLLRLVFRRQRGFRPRRGGPGRGSPALEGAGSGDLRLADGPVQVLGQVVRPQGGRAPVDGDHGDPAQHEGHAPEGARAAGRAAPAGPAGGRRRGPR